MLPPIFGKVEGVPRKGKNYPSGRRKQKDRYTRVGLLSYGSQG